MALSQAEPSSEDELSSAFENTRLNDTLFKILHTEEIHTKALDAAHQYHENLRKLAQNALAIHEAEEAHRQLQILADQEEERVRLETERAKEECRLRDIENRERSIPRPAPRVPTPPPVETPKPATPPVQKAPSIPPPQPAQPAAQLQQPVAKQSPTAPSQLGLVSQSKRDPPKPTPQPALAPIQQQSQLQPKIPQPAQPSPPTAQPAHVLEGTERYVEIHKNLKALRRAFEETYIPQVPGLKPKAGTMRRHIRMTMGQLTPGRGTNKAQIEQIMQTLREALQDTSVPVDPNLFTVSRPSPKEGAANNGEQISGLFIWLLGHLAKAVVKQCIDEVAISHKNADPIGVVVATVMSNPEFHWRGESLIDIIMSKFRVTAPALFGIRGNDKTEAGRTKLGWRRDKDTGAWADSAEENVRRMTGLGRGYAAISLRDFSRSRSTNPWPPSRYWTTIACITSAPPGEASSTHYAVLKGMISQFEERFLAFYGTAGIAALKVALVDFPRRAEKGNVGAQALTAVADGLRKDHGLVLDPKLYKW